MGLFDFNNDRFFSEHEKLILDKICLNVHNHLNQPDIKNLDQIRQKGQYTKAGAPFYWYSEYLDYSYSSNAGKRSITFYKYFYKNKREYKFIEYLEHSFFDEYSPGYHKSLWDDSLENFPVIFLVIHSRNKELDGSIIKMEYENNMVSKNIEDIINKKTIEILNKMF